MRKGTEPAGFLVAIFVFFVCSNFFACRHSAISNEERLAIRQKVSDDIDTLFWAVDIRKALEVVWNSPEFIYQSNARSFTYDQFRARELKIENTIKKQGFIFARRDIDVVNDTIAYAILEGKLINTLNDNSLDTIPFTETIIFKPKENDWKMVFMHASFEPKNKS